MTERYKLVRPDSLVEDAWLRMGDLNGLEIENRFVGLSQEDLENPGSMELRTMLNPAYLGFAAKILLDVDLLPEQCAILHELWIRPFPMFLASRGFGKAVRPNELVRVPGGWKEIKDLNVGDKVYGSDGKKCRVTGTTALQSNLEMYRITLRDGRRIDCCEDHMWKVWDKNKNRKKNRIWSNLTTKEMAKKFFWDRKGEKSNGKEYRFALPINDAVIEDEKHFTIHPYILGVLLGDGCMTQKTISISSTDREIIDRVSELLPDGYKIRGLKSDKTTYTITRLNKNVPPFYKILNEIGIWKLNSKTKFIPQKYHYGSIEQRFHLLKGLMDTDGYSNGQSVIEYYTISDKLSEDIMNLVRSLGIHCKHATKQSWYKKKRYKDCHRISLYTDKAVFSLKRKLEYLKHTISKQGVSRYEKVFITNIEYIGKGEGYCIEVNSPDRTYLLKNYIVSHNSFMLAIYATLRAALVPNTKIVGVGAAFRQARVIYEYMENIWKNAHVLRSICSGSSGPRQAVDRCTVIINDSSAIFIPLGDGQKIRGLRANTIIADEFGCLDKDSIVETKDGFIRISDFDNAGYSDIITGDEKCPYEKPSRFVRTPLTDVYEIKLSNGCVIKCSNIHKLMTNKGWKKSVDLVDGDYLEESNHLPKFGKKYLYELNEDFGWLLGILVSEGCVRDEKLLSITTTDVKICEKLVNKYGFKFNYVEEYIDERDWVCKPAYKCWKYDKELRQKLYSWGLDYVTAHHKKIPFAILKSPESVIRSFLSGLFDGDGSCFLWKDQHRENCIGLAYYSVSERLCRDVQFIMSRLGFDGYINNRESNISNNLQWFVRWNNRNAKIAATYLGVKRFQNTIKLCSIPLEPLNYCWDKDRKKWKVSIVYCGETIQKRFNTEQQAKDFVNKVRNYKKYRKVISVTKLKDQDNLYDYYLPQTNSFYAEGHRQHNSIPPDIYETVVRGFAVVGSAPVEGVKSVAKREALKKQGRWTDKEETAFKLKQGNQCIISGTADYDFKHFADYWKKYIVYIKSKNSPDKTIKLPSGEIKTLRDVFMDGIPDAFDYRDYSIMRIPYELIPKGFMDDKVVAAARSSNHSAIYQKEYGAVFPADSDGFFKRSLIESCVTSTSKDIVLPYSGKVWFDPMICGVPGRQYIYGIDPAAESDNFSIVILEVHPDHTRIVYGWSTNMADFQKRKKAGMVSELDYYGFCCRKIRNLMKVFPTDNIAIDAQGGGLAVLESFHDPHKLQRDHSGHMEHFLWPTNRVLDPDKELPTDNEPGRHIIHMCQFANFQFTSMANHGTRKDLEDKVLLFPRFDPVSLELAAYEDLSLQKSLKVDRLYDTLEDCVMEIEALKDELCTIVMTRTGTGNNSRDRWDTPETTTLEGRKTRMRKDRYSAFIMANFIARSIHRAPAPISYSVIGGFAHQIGDSNRRQDKNQEMYQGPEWFTQGMKEITKRL